MRDQMIGLSWAMLLTGLLLLPLEWLILERDTFFGILHVMLTPLVLGAVGLWWFQIRGSAAKGQDAAPETVTPPAAEPVSGAQAQDAAGAEVGHE